MVNPLFRTHATKESPSVLRHHCTSCGGSCEGARVSFYDRAEEQRIRNLGIAMGHKQVIEDGKILHIDGRCLFLQSDALCAIHAVHGWAAKPQVCKQFPLVATRAEGEIRMGLDPACFSSMQRAPDEAEVDVERVVVGRVSVSENEAQLERQMVHFCESGLATPSSICHWICGLRPAGEASVIPLHLVDNIWQYLRAPEQFSLLSNTSLPKSVSVELASISRALKRFEVTPELPILSVDEKTWSIEALRRVLYLRLYFGGGGVAVTCLAMMMGTILCAGAGNRGAKFGAAYAAWIRFSRYPIFWQTLFPNPDTLHRLIRQS